MAYAEDQQWRTTYFHNRSSFERPRSGHIRQAYRTIARFRDEKVWLIRTRLELDGDERKLALFNLAIDCKLRGCDLVSLEIGDVAAGGGVRSRGAIIQMKHGRPVQFGVTENTRRSVDNLLFILKLRPGDYLFRSRPGLSTFVYTSVRADCTRLGCINWSQATYGTHSLRRTKIAITYRKTGNLRAVQL